VRLGLPGPESPEAARSPWGAVTGGYRAPRWALLAGAGPLSSARGGAGRVMRPSTRSAASRCANYQPLSVLIGTDS
jgi:hypothetical protein